MLISEISIKKISCVCSFHRVHMVRLVDKVPGERFEFGSGRILVYSCTGVRNVIFGCQNYDNDQI